MSAPGTRGAAQSAPGRAGRREWLGLAVIALPCLLYAMDLTVLNLAIPSISRELKPSGTQLLWIVDIYGFMVSGMLITMGTLGDRIGRRRLLMIGAAAFSAASVAAACSTSASMLIAWRAVLGIAGATLAPSTLSLIRSMFNDPHERSVAIGVWIASFSAGAAIGPVLGGVVLQFHGWGAVFLLGVPVMALLLAVGPFLLPEYRDPAPRRLDLASVAPSMAAVIATIYGLKEIAGNGVAPVPAAAMVAGLGIGALFLRRQRRLADPMIDLRLFRDRVFSAALASYGFGCFAAIGVFIFEAQYLQLVLSMSPIEAGLWTTPIGLAFIVGAMLAPRVARRHGAGSVITAGLWAAGFGFGLVALACETRSLGGLVAGFIVYSLGLAHVFTLATDIIVSSAPPERAGAASALSETGSEFGAAVGIAILGSIGTAVYRRALPELALPGASAETLAAARDTLGAAIGLSQQIGGDAGAVLKQAACDAFVHGLSASALVAAAGLGVLAWLTAGTLRRPVAAAHAAPEQTGASS
jgi:DHA2 family multidrug resistance protein-like MFS transporter